MKRIIAMLLVIAMIAVLVACGDEKKPPVGPADDTNAPGEQTDGTNPSSGDPVDTTPVEDEYMPDPDCKFSGMIGVGAVGGTAYFENLKVVSRASNKLQLENNDLESGELPAYNYSPAEAWSIVSDPTKEYEEGTEESKINHVLKLEGADNGIAYTGNKEWNFYQYSLKVLPSDENTNILVYFAYQDENNYYVLSLGEEGNTRADCYKVENGEKSSAAFKINNTLPLDAYTAVGITINQETIDIYIAGSVKFALYDPTFTNQYYPYDGEIIPASISVCNYGAPGEGVEYFPVTEENVIHDGKGTWSNALTTLPTKAFDFDLTTFYDADEKEEAVTTEAELIGIYGDGTFATSYVGGYFADGICVTALRYCPRSDQLGRMTNGSFQGSEDGETWIDLGYVDESPAANDFVTVMSEDSNTVFKYVRYVAPAEGYGNIAEFEIWGKAAN